MRARLAAKLVTLDGTRRTLLLDLSLTGARIRASAELRTGQQAVLCWANFEAFGTVVWVARGLAGVAFDEPLDPGTLYATRDLDQLPNDRELERNMMREWVDGSRRV